MTERILHIAAGCWAQGGGLSEAVAWLAYTQAQQGHAVSLVFTDAMAEHPMVQRCREVGVKVSIFHVVARNPLYFSWGLWRELPRLVKGADRVHLHGCWTFPIWWGAACARKARIPYLVSPHGSLDPVRRAYGRLRKALAWSLFDKRVLQGATLLHATSEREAGWLREALGAACPPIREAALGVDAKILDSLPPQPRKKTFLFLGRLHPLKGLDLLADAWQKSGLTREGWQLHVAGPADGATLPEVEGLTVLPPLHGEAKVQALKSAACLVLPTRTENFGLVVAEALWCKTPVICTKGAPWSILGDFWVETSADAFAEAMLRIAKGEGNFEEAFAWVRQYCTWEACAEALAGELPLKSHRYGFFERIRFNLPSLVAHFLPRKPLHLLTAEETLRKVKAEHLSLARFGDGEFRVMRGGGVGFQRPEKSLRQALKEVAKAPAATCLLALPKPCAGDLEGLTPKAADIWKRILRLQKPWIARTFGGERVYGDALASRFYLDREDAAYATQLLGLWKDLWQGREVLVIEGAHGHFGEESGILAGATSVTRLSAPDRDGWSHYEELLEQAKVLATPQTLILIALGPTATVLANALAKDGYQAVDCGHREVEALWLAQGATEKKALKGHWVDEAGGLV